MSELSNGEGSGPRSTPFVPAALLIGASTGGPPVVEAILKALPAEFHMPVAVCQHMPPGFTGPWTERLDRMCPLEVREARDGERFRRGTVYVAPIGSHMRFVRTDRVVYISLGGEFDAPAFTPSIDCMMFSAAETFRSGTLAVLLTGLGADGAMGLRAVRTAGGYTIVENPNTALAPSMPQSAVDLGAAIEISSAERIPVLVRKRAEGIMTGA